MTFTVPLNLPDIQLRCTREEDKIYFFDNFRKKKIMLTPEEWVRQHFAYFLVNQLHYPKSLIRVESATKFNQLMKRTDIVVYNRSGVADILVECKSFEAKLNQSALNQASMYNQSVKARWIVITNGIKHFVFEIDMEKRNYIQANELPSFDSWS